MVMINSGSNIIYRFYLVILLFLLILLTSACDKFNFFSRPYVATVNGVELYEDEFQERLAQKKAMLSDEILSYKDNYARRLEEEVLDNMITEKLMLMRAAELNITVGNNELESKIDEFRKDYGDGINKTLLQSNLRNEKWREELRKQLLIKKLIALDVNAHVQVSNDEGEDYFMENRQNYKNEARVRLAQIFVREPEKAQEAEKQLLAGGDFGKVAADFSISPEATQGGDLGFITRQVMPEQLDETIFNLPLNKTSPIIKSPYGYHIFKVTAKEPARLNNYEDVKEQVIADLRAKKEDEAFMTWIEALKIKAIIKKRTMLKNNK